MISQFILDLLRDLLLMLLHPLMFAYTESLVTFVPSVIAGIQYINAFLGTILPAESWFIIASMIATIFVLAFAAPVVRFIIRIIRN